MVRPAPLDLIPYALVDVITGCQKRGNNERDVGRTAQLPCVTKYDYPGNDRPDDSPDDCLSKRPMKCFVHKDLY
jgi:hypothetical protein